MTQKTQQGAVTPKSVVLRQMIFCLAALGIVGVGVWSLMGRSAPYHPEITDDDVTRGDASELMQVTN